MANADSGERLREVVDRLQGEVAELHGSRKRLAEAAHDDRRAIERALHDGVQQHLIAFAVQLRRLAGLLDGDPAAARALLDEMATNVRRALDETTELAQRVYPAFVEGRGLASVLRSMAGSSGVTVLVDVPGRADYPPEINAAVYWSCVDTLTSAPPGSQATASVRDADGGVIFVVAVAGHHGEELLDRLRDRVEALGGRFSVEEDDLGSRVHGWLPVSR